MIPFSVLDLCPVPEGMTTADALRHSAELARHCEKLGYHRYWLAEHHNMPGIASAATSVVIGHVAAATSTIRVGSGGIMLPNHAPLVIAEQFGTLASLFPGRIDLGLGRAPGTDMRTARALRRDLQSSSDDFPRDVLELQAYFQQSEPGQSVRAVPGEGLRVPIWILGSSLFGAQLAAAYGLPFSFASHFAPEHMEAAIEIYRARFQPSPDYPAPYVMLAVSAFVAESERAARRLFTSQQQAFANLRRGAPGKLPAPIDDIELFWTPDEREMSSRALKYAFVGTPDVVGQGLGQFITTHRPDELIVSGHIFEHDARLRSYELLAGVRDELARQLAPAFTPFDAISVVD